MLTRPIYRDQVQTASTTLEQLMTVRAIKRLRRPKRTVVRSEGLDTLPHRVAVAQDLWELGMLLVLVGIVSFLAGWFTLGVAAIRLDRSSALKPA